MKNTLKEVRTTNLFGNGPIKRTEPIVKKEAKKTETGIHSDEEFEKSLLEIDGLDQLETNDQKNDVVKHITINESPENTTKKTIMKNHKDDSKKTANENPKDSAKVKTNGDHRHGKSHSKSHHESAPSTSKDSTKIIDDIKKDVRDTNKRKFAEFIDENDKDSSKKKKSDPVIESKKNGDIKTENHDVTENYSILDLDHIDSKNKKRKMSKSSNESGKEFIIFHLNI